MSNKISLSIITVTFNNQKHINIFLESIDLHRPKNSEVILIDNNSIDETVKIIKSSGKNIRLIENKKNIGFAKACNQGVKLATGEYIFFLNPDTEILDDAVNKLLLYLKKDSKIGLISPKLITNNGSVQPSIRNLPTLIGVIKEYYLNQENSYQQYVPKNQEALAVEVVYGAAIMLPKKVFVEIEGFNERYFLYYEDIDLCKKVSNLGLKIVYLPRAKIKHLIGGSGTEKNNLPPIIRTLAQFIPIKDSGRTYYQIMSSNIYHGTLKMFIMRLLIYIALKLKIYRNV